MSENKFNGFWNAFWAMSLAVVLVGLAIFIALKIAEWVFDIPITVNLFLMFAFAEILFRVQLHLLQRGLDGMSKYLQSLIDKYK